MDTFDFVQHISRVFWFGDRSSVAQDYDFGIDLDSDITNALYDFHAIIERLATLSSYATTWPKLAYMPREYCLISQ